VRVKDPLEDLDVGKRKAVLWTVCAVLLLVAYALAYPTKAGTIAVIGAFFLMIMLHEAGHFAAAKHTGMKVTEFFVGFGPRLWSFKRGETEFGVKAIPAGGYCRIIGMTNIEEVAPEDEARTYRSKSWHSRVAVAGAGPATHFIIAFMLMFVVLYFGGDYRHTRATTTLFAVSAGAEQAGLQKGDEIVAINGTAVRNWDQVHDLVAGTAGSEHHPGDIARFVVRRGDQVLDKTVVLQQSEADPKVAIAGISPHVYLPHPGLVAAAAEAPRELVTTANQSIQGLGKIFSPSGMANYYRVLTGSADKEVQQQRFISPIGLYSIAGDAVKSGWENALLLLLPFDGGHIAIASYEKVASTIRRRPVSVDVTKLLPITIAVLALFILIGVTSVYLDITHPLQLPK
jgi:membrane-associated protease RseP (regulator of RpoE activity)